MAFLTKEDLYTHIDEEVIDQITRDQDERVVTCINEAIAEAKTYLSRFDLLALFGDDETEPSAPNIEHLKGLVKDITCWQLIKGRNPNVDLQMFRTLYEDALKALIRIQEGKTDPQGWPYLADDPETPSNENTTIQYTSNPKRTQHF